MQENDNTQAQIEALAQRLDRLISDRDFQALREERRYQRRRKRSFLNEAESEQAA